MRLPPRGAAPHVMSSRHDEGLILAYRTHDSVEARSLAAELEDADIETQIIGDFRDAYSGLLVGSMADKEIWISEGDRLSAERIVADWRRTYHPQDLEPVKEFQFSLRAALIALTLAALILGLYQINQTLCIVVLQVTPLALFAIYAARRLSRRRRNDDSEPLPGQQADQGT
jgi:hypothetical protein